MNASFQRLVASGMAVAVALSLEALAAPKSSDHAQAAVQGWLRQTPRPFGGHFPQKKLAKVHTYQDEQGRNLYHVVALQPEGFVIAGADSDVEPIIAFSEAGDFIPDPRNPLFALAEKDLRGRMERLRQKAAAGQAADALAATKWQSLALPQAQAPLAANGLSGLDDPRVSPFIQSRWDQQTVSNYLNGVSCYNYYTPPYAAGTTSNYPCGCNNTAWAQIMRYFSYPTQSVGTASYTITVNGVATNRQLRGGDGLGGPYAWASMPFIPTTAITLAQRQAIGTLTMDIGAVSSTDYASSGSSASLAVSNLLQVFRYSNAIIGGWDSVRRTWGDLSQFTNAANACLDARLPVYLSISGGGAHAVVCDGYGYNQGVLYHHLNMGWSGRNDAWYNLPNVDTTVNTYTAVDYFDYNIFTSGTGEVISGRLLDPTNGPISGAAVYLTGTGLSLTNTTDSRGIYAFAQIPSNKTCTLNAAKAGFLFSSSNVVTGRSVNYGATGNKWGVSLAGTPVVTVTVLPSPSDGGSASGGGTYVVGTNVLLTASPSNSWVFVGWNDGVTNLARTITVPATNIIYLASFLPTAVITTSVNTNRGGTVSGGGTYTVGSTAVLTATVSNGWLFTGWNTGSTNNPLSVVVPAGGASYTANFAPAVTLTLQASPTNGGTVSGAGSYAQGSVVPIGAQAGMSWKFVAWSDGNTNSSRNLLLTGNLTLTASFTNAPVQVLLQAGDGGMSGLWTLNTNYTPATWSLVSGSLGNGWVLRALNNNRILLQAGAGGMIGLWSLNASGAPTQWWLVSGPLPGWIARDLDGNRVLLQAGDGGMIGIWTLSSNNTPAAWAALSGPIAGVIARGFCGNRVLLQFAGGNPCGYWTLDGANNITAWTPIGATVPPGWILRSMTAKYMLLQAGDGGPAGMWDLDANGQPTAWHTISGSLPGWILRGIDQP